MAIINRISPEEIRSKYTHYARFVGLLPCYVALYEEATEEVELQVANGYPDFLLPAVSWFYGQFIAFMSLCDDDYEPAWSLVITGEIEES